MSKVTDIKTKQTHGEFLHSSIRLIEHANSNRELLSSIECLTSSIDDLIVASSALSKEGKHDESFEAMTIAMSIKQLLKSLK